ncbi:MAG: HAMP domain-containing histidine kinase [Hyphomicrobium sp.]|jgi:signal transduction histidine kinase|nr:HAMP domain-containing histidine kinase [Hyphomicrobium sp.]
MPFLRTLRARLIAAAALWILIGVAIAGFVLSGIFRQHVTNQFKEELFIHLAELQRLAKVEDGNAVLSRPLSDPRYDEGLSGFYWEIQKGSEVLARSASMRGPLLHVPLDDPQDVGVHLHTGTGPTGQILVAEQADWKTPSGPVIRFLIGTDQRHIDKVIHDFDHTVGLSLAGFAGTLILAAALLIAFAMRPFSQLRVALGKVRGGEAKQIDGPFPAEVQPLIDDLNGLLLSTGELVQRARTQAGNIAHGLKTPMAILSDEADRLERDGAGKSALNIAAQLKKMQAHIDYQITRARASAAHVTIGNSSSISVAVDEVISALQRLHRERSITVTRDVPADVRAACDRQDVNEILANLLDNAFKHTTSEIRVTTRHDRGRNRLVVTIDDNGAGLPLEARDVVFNIGERWDSQVAGSGLGLAIARDLAQLYGGDVVLDSSPLGGLRALLTLPAVRPDTNQ